MPLFKIEREQNTLNRIEPRTFAAVKIRERQDLQALLRDNPSVISPDLFILSEEFSTWQESSRRVDLLALDRDANLVVIELKRVEDGGHMELQAIRYAAMLSTMDFEAVVSAYEDFLSNPGVTAKQNQSSADARQQILEFLGVASAEEVAISSTPRIILMSPSFSKEITTTVLWLNDIGLDIRCLEVKPYQLSNELYLDIEQVIPLPSANTYMIQRLVKAIKDKEIQVLTKRRERTVPLLITKGILKPDTRLHLIKLPRPGLTIPEKAKYATFLDSQETRWNYDNKVYSLSALCRVICEQFGGSIGTGAFAGPDYWAIEGESVSLTDKAKSLDLTVQLGAI